MGGGQLSKSEFGCGGRKLNLVFPFEMSPAPLLTRQAQACNQRLII